MNQNLSSLEDPIMTVPEVARYLKISKAKMYYLVSRKQIPHIRLGRNVRVRKSDLLNWLSQKLEKEM
jgi:excisionase family DNA binding protein